MVSRGCSFRLSTIQLLPAVTACPTVRSPRAGAARRPGLCGFRIEIARIAHVRRAKEAQGGFCQGHAPASTLRSFLGFMLGDLVAHCQIVIGYRDIIVIDIYGGDPRSNARLILPVAVFGSSATMSIAVGTLKAARRSRHMAIRTSMSMTSPGLGVTNALTVSPR